MLVGIYKVVHGRQNGPGLTPGMPGPGMWPPGMPGRKLSAGNDVALNSVLRRSAQTGPAEMRV